MSVRDRKLGLDVEQLADMLARLLGAQLAVHPDELERTQPFASFGLKSREIVALTATLQAELGFELSSVTMYNHSCIETLALHLADLCQRPAQQNLASSKAATASADMSVPLPEDEPIAIVGMGLRFAQDIVDAESYWRVLSEGRDVVTEIPRDRWDVDAHFDPDPAALGKMMTRYGGFIREHDRFDAAFFGISEREARGMDPQQRVLLEVTWEALENAGIAPSSLKQRDAGVFMGLIYHEYGQIAGAELSQFDGYVAIGNASSVASGRISYLLDLKGPSLTVDTACSSSLVSLHLACQSLRTGECSLALAGGVSLLLTPAIQVEMSRQRVLSPDGRCKAFDAEADGTAWGEGAGVLVLKRLSVARAEGDRILALVRGTAVNQDGRSSGLTAPSGPAQEAVVRRALSNARLSPAEIDYVEAHGTGTPLGDPIEALALAAVFGQGPARERPLLLGAVKSNLGHTQAAAGIAGVIKTVLALAHERIPSTLHVQTPTPRVPWADLPLQLVKEAVPWPRATRPRVAGVSSFGMSGTNAHALIEEAPLDCALVRPVSATGVRPPHLLVLSAQTLSALRQQAERLAAHLEQFPEHSLEDVCFTAANGRDHFEYRLAVTGVNRVQLVERLRACARGETPDGSTSGRSLAGRQPKLVFVFSGYGSQWLGMGRALSSQQPVFREALEACDRAIACHTGWSVLAELQADESSSRLSEVDVLQPVLFALAVALSALLESLGIRPDAVLGHSLGEVAAAHVAGALSLDDAARLVACRSQLLRELRGRGAMLLTELTLAQAEQTVAAYSGQVSVAVCNARRSTVLSGDAQAIAAIQDQLTARSVFCRPIKAADGAGHSPHVDALLGRLAEALSDLTPQPAHVPMYSTVTCERIDGSALTAAYWQRNLREPVRFFETVEGLLTAPTVLLELSPHPVLLSALQEIIGEHGARADQSAREGGRVVLASLHRERPDQESLWKAIAELFVHGAPLELARVCAGRPVALPSYAFQRERFWVDAPPGRAARAALPAGSHPLLGSAIHICEPPTLRVWRATLQLDALPYLRDHRAEDVAILPAAAYLEMACAAARELFGEGPCTLEEVAFSQVLTLPEEAASELQVCLELEGTRAARFRIVSRWDAQGSPGGFTLHATGKVCSGVATVCAEADAELGAALARLRSTGQDQGPSADLYQRLAEQGFAYGPSFQGIRQLWTGQAEALGEIRSQLAGAPAAAGYWLHPATLDACLQVLAGAHGTDLPEGPSVPVAVASMSVHGRLQGDLRCLARVRRQADQSFGDLTIVNERGERLLEATGVRFQQLEPRRDQNAQDDWLLGLQWEPSAALPETLAARTRKWLVVGQSDLWLRAELCRRLGESAASCDVSELAVSLETLRAGGEQVLGVVQLCGVTSEAQAEVPTDAERAAIQVLHAAQALAAAAEGASLRLWLLTQQVHALDGDACKPPAVNLVEAPIWGMGRSLAQEHPALGCSLIDLSRAPGGDELEALIRELLHDGSEQELVLRGAERYVARIVRGTVNTAQGPAIRSDRTYLIAGGVGGLGLALAESLVARGARHLVLMGRTGLATHDQARAVANLEESGAQVHVACADVADPTQLAAVLARVPPEYALAGVVHAAATLDDGVLHSMTAERCARVMRAKVFGGWNLHQQTEQLALDFFVLYSSAASFVGSPGQINYAAANAFLDALAHLRRRTGQHALSVNWGPFEDLGAAADDDRRAKRLAQRGVLGLTAAEGARTLFRLLGSDATQAAVLPLQRKVWARAYPELARSARFSKLLPRQIEQDRTDSSLRSAILAAVPHVRRTLIESFVREQLAQRLKRDPGGIDRHAPLASLGLDSLLTLELRNKLEAGFGIKLSATLAWSYPTLAKLNEFFCQRMAEEAEAAPDSKVCAATPTPARTQPPAAEVAAPDAPTARPSLPARAAPSSAEPIAIIGLGCRFPGGADSPEAFWELLTQGRDAVSTVPSERWNNEDWLPHLPADQRGALYGAFLEQVEDFDPAFFGMSRAEARQLDPQQRLLLEVSWEALERSGQAPQRLRGSSTGVFVGISGHDHVDYRFVTPPAELDAHGATGNGTAFAAGRISYLLGLEGPSLCVDTVCSSSLVALHLACQSLRSGECTMALVGAVNVILSPLTNLVLARTRALSPSGRCRTFDAAADGAVRGEGCGVVVLKPLSVALAAGDRIHALIRGSAVNQDGRSSGLTAPNGMAQQSLLRRALAQAGTEARQVSYVEAHGTGTPLGDPIELEALRNVLGAPRADGSECTLGSVKTNIGHLEAAAGMAGLIKLVLALEHQQIPAHLHFNKLNPSVSLAGSCFAIARTARAWPRCSSPRIAGLSAFGMSGTNAHIIVEEAPEHVQAAESSPLAEAERPLQLIALSAATPDALLAQATSYADHLAAHPHQHLTDVCFTANTARGPFAYRRALVIESAEELSSELRQAARWTPKPAQDRPQTAFLFTGQGAQYPGMAYQLDQAEPVFTSALDRCAEILAPELDVPLRSLLFERDRDTLDRTLYTQPALFAVEWALAQLWQSWGVEPDALFGHSLGEYVAACVAGVFSLEAGLTLVARRAKLMQQLPEPSGMLAVQASEQRVRELLAPDGATLAIAAINGPLHTIVSGALSGLAALAKRAAAQRLKSKPLRVSHGFHSPLLQPMIEPFAQLLEGLTLAAPQRPLISNLTGELADARITTVDYWLRHTLAPVQFQAGMQTLAARGVRVFLELGPQPVLLGMGALCLPGNDGLWLASLRQNRGDCATLLASAARLYEQGVELDLAKLSAAHPSLQRVALPTYPFQRSRCWIDRAALKKPGQLGIAVTDLASSGAHPDSSTPGRPHMPNLQSFVEELVSMPAALARRTLRERMEEQLRRVLGSNEPIDEAQGFASMGLDSFMTTELMQGLRDLLGMDLPAVLAFEHPSLASLSEHLYRQLCPADHGARRAPAPTAEPPAVVGSAAEHEHEHEQQQERLLEQKLFALESVAP